MQGKDGYFPIMFFTNYFKKYISDNLSLKGVNNLEIKNKYEKLRVKIMSIQLYPTFIVFISSDCS